MLLFLVFIIFKKYLKHFNIAVFWLPFALLYLYKHNLQRFSTIFCFNDIILSPSKLFLTLALFQVHFIPDDMLYSDTHYTVTLFSKPLVEAINKIIGASLEVPVGCQTGRRNTKIIWGFTTSHFSSIRLFVRPSHAAAQMLFISTPKVMFFLSLFKVMVYN